MNHKSFIFIISLSLLPIISFGLEIKDGYWLGLKVMKNQYANRSNFEEWQFSEGDNFARKSFRHNIEKSETYFSGKYAIQNDSISFSSSTEDKNYIIHDNPNNDEDEITITYLIEKKEQYYIITDDNRSTKTYLFFYSDSEPISIKENKEIIYNKLFSINEPDLFYNSNEVEFWEYASFYNDEAYPKCHHNFQCLKAGEMTFILFQDLEPLMVKSADENKVILFYVNDYNKELILSKKETDVLYDPLKLNGDWTWKARKKISDEKNNIYTIHIGYPIHRLSIKKDTVKWHTQIYEKNLIECHPDSIAEQLNRFSYNQINRREYGEDFIISPSQRLVLIDTYNTFRTIRGRDNFYRDEKMLRFISNKNNEFIFKELSLMDLKNGINTISVSSDDKPNYFIILNK